MSLPKSWSVPVLSMFFFEQRVQVVGIEDVDAHARQRDIGMAGHRGADRRAFRRSPVTRRLASTCITPNAVASMRGTSMQPTVQSAPLSTWSASIRV